MSRSAPPVAMVARFPYILLAVVLAAFALPACDDDPEFPRIGVSRSAEDALVLHLAPCENEVIQAFELAAVKGEVVGDADDETLWRVEAVDSGSPALTAVEVGSVPPGFREVVPLSEDVPENLNAVFEGDPGAQMQVTSEYRDAPKDGRILWTGERMPRDEFASTVLAHPFVSC